MKIAHGVWLDESEIKFTYIQSSGPGGQNVNKVATSVQLRFDVVNSPSLPEPLRARITDLLANKLTSSGEIIIKANRFRTQGRNKQDALNRLQELLTNAATPPKKRKKTRPTLAAKQRRLKEKKLKSKTKLLRSNKLRED